MKHKIIYLAAPYSHPREWVRMARFTAINKAAGVLIAQGNIVFSPISHSHPIALEHALPGDFDFWQRFCEAFVSRCQEVMVLKLHGWMTSKGVQSECELAEALGIPIRCVTMDQLVRGAVWAPESV